MKKHFLYSIILILVIVASLGGCQVKEKKITDLKREEFYNVNEQMRSYLNMTVGELIELTGEDIDKDGSEMVFEHDFFFPCIYLKDFPFYIICRSYDVNDTPLYVAFYEEDVEAYLGMLELGSNMIFDEIMAVMGSVPIYETERAGDKRYKIEIAEDKLKYVFCADNQEGNNFSFYIGLAEEKDLTDGADVNDIDSSQVLEYAECSDGKLIEVYKDIHYQELCARYYFGKEREYWADYQLLPMDDGSYQMRFELFNQNDTVQTLIWDSYFVKYPEFVDVNEDGYVDMNVVIDSVPAYDTVELYIWDEEKNCFQEVICEEQLAHIESKEGQLWNWTRYGEGYVLQIFTWKDNELIKVSEDVIMPDVNEE